MRRTLALLVAACLALLTFAVVAGPPAVAADPITGRLVDYSGSHPPVVGATVRLRTVTEDGPGEVVDTDVTDSDGRFSLDAGPSPDDEYYVQVLAGKYQGGYIGSDYVQPTPGDAVTWGPHAAIGKIGAVPAFIRGVVVNAATGNPVSGVKVTVRTSNHLYTVIDADVTGRAGVFQLNGITCEDNCALKLNGAAKGYEVGWRACNAHVVAAWGDACASQIGRIGKVFLDKD